MSDCYTLVQISRKSIGEEDGKNKVTYSARLAIKSDNHCYDLVNGWENFINDEWIDPAQPKYDVIPAVYCFYDSNRKPLYVGETNRLYARTIIEHLKGDTNTVAYELFLRFRYLRIYDLSIEESAHRKLLEQMIIFDQKPLYNLMTLGLFEDKEHFCKRLSESLTRDNWSDVTVEQRNWFENKFPRNQARINKWKEKDRKRKEKELQKIQTAELKKIKKKEGSKKGSL
ncbi:hypothetical protein [Paenibacillus agri]|uniref:GIY-YIG domain-containing protein n=1 Tax=Paenibacillus agri TaxID=2744309 RepID=A0A850ET35_9BACL|nr:hypothetical protein [Paenibacillus agri]NUU61121.1 hypothetical protein [Paenibacillus agri]